MLSDVEKLQKRQLLEVLDEKHNATQIVTKQRGLSQTVKDLIEELISDIPQSPLSLNMLFKMRVKPYDDLLVRFYQARSTLPVLLKTNSFL